ncbi:hypothetical protein HAX54_040439, partial [Datura stramonium]|nr:hypothetical protein [Datura stramonium]
IEFQHRTEELRMAFLPLSSCTVVSSGSVHVQSLLLLSVIRRRSSAARPVNRFIRVVQVKSFLVLEPVIEVKKGINGSKPSERAEKSRLLVKESSRRCWLMSSNINSSSSFLVMLSLSNLIWLSAKGVEDGLVRLAALRAFQGNMQGENGYVRVRGAFARPS